MALESMSDPGISFAVDDYAIGILLNLSPETESVKITHPDKGDILISPKRGEYIARISDAPGFFQADKSVFTVTVLKEKFPSDVQVKSMEDLLWEATQHASQGRLIEGLHKYDVVQFTRWPNLTRVSITPNVMRICALLTRFPSGAHLAQAILGIKAAEMYAVCSAAKVIGIVKLLNRTMKSDADEDKQVEELGRRAESKSGLFLGRLFSKLSGL
jgi:hypothetical protein